jgi:ketosteroid isomerase-like protein
MVITDLDVLVSTWANAERGGDGATLHGLLTDDFVGIGPVGFMLPKDIWAARFEHGLHYDDLDIVELSTRRYGNAALLVGRQRAHGVAQGHSIPDDTRVSIVATRDDPKASWQIAHIQYSLIAGAVDDA